MSAKQRPEDYRSKELCLLFLHIGKAGGTTLHRIVDRQYSPRHTYTIDGLDVKGSITDFIALPDEEREKIRLLKGHMPFGLHQYFRRPTAYITMLRNPAERVISHYYFARSNPKHYLHETANRVSLTEYVTGDLSTELTDGQTRLVSGSQKIDSVKVDEQPVSAATLETAKQNLREHFAAVGLTEQFDASLLLYKRLFGWGDVFYAKQNVTKSRPDRREIPREVISLIEKHNQLDMELYAFAKEMFEEQVRAQGASFQAELEAFQEKNKGYGKGWKGSGSARGVLRKVRASLRNLRAS
jgi:hypothetical protein